MTRDAIAIGDKRGATVEADWGKVKFDRQIVAIARVLGASTIYTNDGQLALHAKAVGIEAIGLMGLPEPPVIPQLEMHLDPIEPEPPSSNGEDDD